MSDTLRTTPGPLCITCAAGRPAPGETRCPPCREERRQFDAAEVRLGEAGIVVHGDPYGDVNPWLRVGR